MLAQSISKMCRIAIWKKLKTKFNIFIQLLFHTETIKLNH